jgi:hypothetical protein
LFIWIYCNKQKSLCGRETALLFPLKVKSQ